MHRCGCESKNMIIAELIDRIDDTATDHQATICKYRSLKDGTNEKLLAKGYAASVITLPSELTKRSFVTDFLITDAFWCTFPAGKDPQRNPPMSCVCIVGDENLQLCPDSDGHIYSISLPFKVNKVLPCEFGLFLQRRPPSPSVKHPTVFPYLFSLSHPYDEILPVVFKNKEIEDSCHYIWDNEEVSVIEVLSSCRLVLCYSYSSKSHYLCCLRQVTKAEWKCAACNAESFVSFASTRTPTARSFLVATTPQPILHTAPRLRTCLGAEHLEQADVTPLRSVRTRSMTAAAALIESLPYPNFSPAQKGSTGRSFREFPASRFRRGSGTLSTPRMNTICDETIATAIDVRGSEIDMIAPEVCIECIWTESIRRNQEIISNSPADYAFLTQDFNRQQLLCFFIKSQSVLKCIRVKNMENDSYISGSLMLIQCRSAAVLQGVEEYNVMPVVEMDGSLVLYTGIQRLGEVYFQHSLTSDSFNASVDEMETPFVQPCSSATTVWTAYNNYFYVENKDGFCYLCRVFPIAVSAFTEDCLRRVGSVLPNDKSMKFLTSWYLNDYSRLVRNCDGNCAVVETSFLLQFVLLQCGINVEGFPYFQEADILKTYCAEGGSAIKKQRTIAERALAWERIRKKDNPKSSIKKFKTDISYDVALYPYSLLVFNSLHLCYENAKLDSRLNSIYVLFAASLHAFASIHNLSAYVAFYVNDYPQLKYNYFEVTKNPQSANASPSTLILSRFCSDKVSSFHDTFLSVCDGSQLHSTLPNSNCFSLVIFLLAVGLKRVRNSSDLQKLAGKNWGKRFGFEKCRAEHICKILDNSYYSSAKKCELCARYLNLTRDLLLDLPPSAALICCELLYSHATRSLTYFNFLPIAQPSSPKPSVEEIEKVVRLRWKNDLRCNNICQMLDSRYPTFLPTLSEASSDNISDAGCRERQEHLLFAVCLRTLAQCFGRGIADFRYMIPPLSRTLAVPPLCLQGRSHPANMQIDLPQTESSKTMNEWGNFYNAVSAGLALGSSESVWLDCEWLSMSASKQSPSVCAGLLYAFGLNGHIASMNLYTIHELLSGDDRLTSVAILLGYAVNKRATSEMQMYKMMVTHLPFLMGPTLLELHIDPMVQTAALVSLGLLFAGSSHLGILGQLVNEIARPAIPDQEPLTDRYSYTLAAGFAIGLISLGRGEELCSNHPFEERIPSLANRLLVLMKGGLRSLCYFPTTLREPLCYGGSNVNSAPQLSNHFRETENVNPHLTASAATVAFGLMYLKTGNKFAADCLELPKTLWEIEQIRPDVILLRTLSRLLIMWEDIYPSKQWVESLVPENFLLHKKRLFGHKRTARLNTELRYVVDPESIAQTYLSIIAGACFAIALRFASTSNAAAFETISYYLSLVLPEECRESCVKELCATAGRYTCALALNTILCSLGILMAGSGNLQVIRICHYLRNRVLVRDAHQDTMAYSTQVAAHMTLGLLILGRARYSLSTNDLSIAALVIAFFPICPSGINDNRMYLQPLRYLWTIAVEERLLAPLCADSHNFLEAEVLLIYKETKVTGRSAIIMKTPCLIPELHLLDKLQVQCPGYETKSFNLKIADDCAKVREIIHPQHGRMLMSISGKNGLGIVLSATKKVLEDEMPEEEDDIGKSENLTPDELQLLKTFQFIKPDNSEEGRYKCKDVEDLCSRIQFFQSDHGSLAAYDFHQSFVKDVMRSSQPSGNQQLEQVVRFIEATRSTTAEDSLGVISLDVVQSLKRRELLQ